MINGMKSNNGLRSKTISSDNNQDENSLAILGPVACGKTVVLCLLDEVIHRYFQDDEKYIFSIEDGIEYLKRISNMMYGGNFPDRTQELFDEPVTLRISNKDPIVKANLDVKIRDISGEVVEKILATGNLNEEERKSLILKFGKPKTAAQSSFGYLINAKMYLIVIDCGEYNNWLGLDWYYAQMVKSLFKIATKNNDGLVDIPIAVILSKSDLMPNKNSDVNNTESIMKLVTDHMPRLMSELKNKHNGQKGYFQLYVKKGSKPNTVETPLSYSVEEYKKLFNMITHSIK